MTGRTAIDRPSSSDADLAPVPSGRERPDLSDCVSAELLLDLECVNRRLADARADDVVAAYEEKAWEEGLEVPPLEELKKLREKAERRKKAAPRA